MREFLSDVPIEPNDSIETIVLRRGRADFHDATGLDLDVTEPDGYEPLLDPMIDIIRRSNLLEQFPGRTETDLYLFAMDHLHYLREQYGDAPADAAVKEMSRA